MVVEVLPSTSVIREPEPRAMKGVSRRRRQKTGQGY